MSKIVSQAQNVHQYVQPFDENYISISVQPPQLVQAAQFPGILSQMDTNLAQSINNQQQFAAKNEFRVMEKYQRSVPRLDLDQMLTTVNVSPATSEINQEQIMRCNLSGVVSRDRTARNQHQSLAMLDNSNHNRFATFGPQNATLSTISTNNVEVMGFDPMS